MGKYSRYFGDTAVAAAAITPILLSGVSISTKGTFPIHCMVFWPFYTINYTWDKRTTIVENWLDKSHCVQSKFKLMVYSRKLKLSKLTATFQIAFLNRYSIELACVVLVINFLARIIDHEIISHRLTV